MSHTITAKLNDDARKHQSQNKTTFFVSVGEKNFNYKTKQNEWTNYDVALFAKDNQVDFYNSALIKGSVVSVSGTGIIVDDSNKDYKPKLVLQDAKLVFVSSGGNTSGGNGSNQNGYQQAKQQPQQQAPMQEPDFDDSDIPF